MFEHEELVLSGVLAGQLLYLHGHNGGMTILDHTTFLDGTMYKCGTAVYMAVPGGTTVPMVLAGGTTVPMVLTGGTTVPMVLTGGTTVPMVAPNLLTA